MHSSNEKSGSLGEWEDRRKKVSSVAVSRSRLVADPGGVGGVGVGGSF